DHGGKRSVAAESFLRVGDDLLRVARRQWTLDDDEAALLTDLENVKARRHLDDAGCEFFGGALGAAERQVGDAPAIRDRAAAEIVWHGNVGGGDSWIESHARDVDRAIRLIRGGVLPEPRV